jgi:hypothetical protein
MHIYSNTFDSLETRCYHNKFVNILIRPWKIGYCLNVPFNLKDVQNKIYKNVIQKNIKSLDVCDKINIILEANEIIYDDHKNGTYLKNVKMLKDMNKQFHRRGKIGYFKGH